MFEHQRIPQDVLQSIFQFVSSKGDWFNIMATCKRFLSVGRIVFNPSVDDNEAIQWASANGKLEAGFRNFQPPAAITWFPEDDNECFSDMEEPETKRQKTED